MVLRYQLGRCLRKGCTFWGLHAQPEALIGHGRAKAPPPLVLSKFKVVPSSPCFSFCMDKSLLLAELTLPASAAGFEGLQPALVSVCFQTCSACRSLHMQNVISWEERDDGRAAAGIVSSCLLPLLASKVGFGVRKSKAGIITAKEDFVCSRCPAGCPVWQLR